MMRCTITSCHLVGGENKKEILIKWFPIQFLSVFSIIFILCELLFLVYFLKKLKYHLYHHFGS